MRTAFFILLLTFGLTLPGYAAPCYGTKMPAQRHFFLGLQSHSIFKRYLENELGKVKSMQHLILLSFGVWDWLSIDLKGGCGNIKQRSPNSEDLDYFTAFSGGYGFRLKLFDRQHTKMVFGFQHISVHPRADSAADGKHQAILDDWQASFLVSYDVGKITPYIGTKWSRVDYIHRLNGNRKRVMSDLTKSIGGILGCDFNLTDKIWINVEGQAFDGEAASLSLNYSF